MLIETEEGHAAFARFASDFAKSGHEATVIMCAEKESVKCRRHSICQRLLEDFGINATRIGYDGQNVMHVQVKDTST